MINLLTLNETFLEDFEVFILGTRDNDELRKHLAADYNVGDKKIEYSVKAFEKAQESDMAYRDEFVENLKAEEHFRTLFYEAYDMVEEHVDFLKIALTDQYQRDLICLFLSHSPAMDLSEWLDKAIDLYCAVLTDRDWGQKVSKRNISRDSLFKGLKMVLDARAALVKLVPETEQAKKAFEKRNAAFRELTDAFVELQIASYHVLGKHPELLTKPSVSNLSPIIFSKMVKDSSITRKVKMVKDSSITRKILAALNKIFGQAISKVFNLGKIVEK